MSHHRITCNLSGFVLRHPAWPGPRAVAHKAAVPALRAIPATLDTYLALHLSDAAPDAAAPAPPAQRQPGRQSMWAARDGHVVLFHAWDAHTDRLEDHWDHYGLGAALGAPHAREVAWGRLDHLEDNRD